jgi:SAM-dependent methyltransferase
MTELTDPAYLRRQYQNAINLDARVTLHQRCSVNPYGFHRWVFDQLQLSPGGHILELGCGPGHLWAENRDRLPGSLDLTLSDFSAGMVSTARNRLSGVSIASFCAADAQHLPFHNQRFDLLIANHMLYHIPNQPQALAEMRRVLRPEGRLIAATNGQSHMQEISELVHAFDPSVHTMSNAVVERFSLENGADLLKHYFRDVRVLRYPDALEVTEAGILVDYVYSSVQGQTSQDDWKSRFTAYVERQLRERGPIHIHKSSGIFLCYPS